MRFKRFWNWRSPLVAALVALAPVVDTTIFLPHPAGTRVSMAHVPICARCEINPGDLRRRRLDSGALSQHYFMQAGGVTRKKAATALGPGIVVAPGLLLENSLADLAPKEAAFALSAEDPAVAGFSKIGQIVETRSSSLSVDNQLLATNMRVLGMEAAKDNLLGAASPRAIVYLGTSEGVARKVIVARPSHDLSLVLRD